MRFKDWLIASIPAASTRPFLASPSAWRANNSTSCPRTRRPFSVSRTRTDLREREREVNAIVYGAVAEHGGSISAEHGIGVMKRVVGLPGETLRLHAMSSAPSARLTIARD